MTEIESGPCTIRTVAIIGAGRAGRGFAMQCAAAGFNVVLEDVMPSNLRYAQEQFAEHRAAATTRGALEVASSIEGAVRTADVVVDFVPDELESKLEIFCLIDRMAPPKTAILTPSEALSITDLASCTYRADRCFAVRGAFQNGASGKVHLLHPAAATAGVLESVAAFLRALGCAVHAEVDTDAPMLTRNAR